MLKLIPSENIQLKNKQKKKIKAKVMALPRLQQKFNAETREENQNIKTAYLHLVDYLHKAGDCTLKEMSELIHTLQRSVVSLEKKRVKLLRKERK